MKYSEKVIAEVESILEVNKDELVLVSDQGTLLIVNRTTHFIKLIDDADVSDLLIHKLKNDNVEEFKSFFELEKKYPKQFIKPMFWPDDRPWPPNSTSE